MREVMRVSAATPRFFLRFDAAFEKAAGKNCSGSSGVKTPAEIADFMSCLKARPTKLQTFSATCDAATHKEFSFCSKLVEPPPTKNSAFVPSFWSCHPIRLLIQPAFFDH
jgi:hypothetical protein